MQYTTLWMDMSTVFRLGISSQISSYTISLAIRKINISNIFPIHLPLIHHHHQKILHGKSRAETLAETILRMEFHGTVSKFVRILRQQSDKIVQYI